MSWVVDVTTDAYLDAVTADEVEIDGYVEVIDQAGQVVAVLGGPDATHPGVTDGTVSWDSDGDVAWSVDLTIADDSLVPRTASDILHPLSYNRVRPWWSIRTRDGWMHVPLGTCYVETVTPVEDGGATVGLSVSGASGLALAKRSLMRASAQVGGYGVGDAASSVLQAAAPWLEVTYDSSLDSTVLPAEHEAGEADADPVEVAAEIAASAGAVLLEDRMGGVRIARRPAGRTSATLVEGPGCRAMKATGGVDVASLFNVVTVVSGTPEDSEGEEVEPVTVTVEDDDESSDTWVGRGVRLVHPTIQLDQVVDEAQARTIAQDKLAELRGALDPVSVECVPLPHIEGGDMVQCGFSRIGVVGARRVAGWSLKLGPTGGMRLDLGAIVDRPATSPIPPSRGDTPLDVPPPVFGRSLAQMARSGTSSGRMRQAIVREAPDPDTGRAVVDLAGQVTPVQVGSDMRGVQVGDRVTVTHQGGAWWIVATRGWRVSPTVQSTGATLVDSAGASGACQRADLTYLRLNQMIPRLEELYQAAYDQQIVREP